MATTRRDIELLISAKETTGRSFSQVTANIDALNRKIAEQVAAAERGEISLQELRQTQQALAAAGRLSVTTMRKKGKLNARFMSILETCSKNGRYAGGGPSSVCRTTARWSLACRC